MNRTTRFWRARTKLRTIVIAVPLALSIATLAACGSDSGGSSEPAAANDSDVAAYVATAKDITARALAHPIYSPSNDYVDPAELKDADTDTWLGSTTAAPVPAGTSIAFVSCGAGACNEAVEAGAKLAEAAGIETHLVNINGKGDVPGLQAAMTSAIALKPTAIVTLAVSATQVADQLDQAREAGIITVSAADPTATGGDGQYDAAADYPNGLSTMLLGWAVVADSDGKANVVAVKDFTFPAVVRKIGNLEKVIKGCGTCTLKTITWQVSDALDPNKAANIITGVINSNPDMDTLVMPYSIGLPSVQQAIAASGRAIKIYADDADSVNLEAVAAGDVTTVSAVDPELVMYQAVNQVLLSLSGQDFTAPDKLPYLAMLYDADNVPSVGPGAFTKYVDYPAVFAGNWKS